MTTATPKRTPRALRRDVPVELTIDQLTTAWLRLRRPHWPPTLVAALQHRLYGPCIRGLARCISRRDTFDPRKLAANDMDAN